DARLRGAAGADRARQHVEAALLAPGRTAAAASLIDLDRLAVDEHRQVAKDDLLGPLEGHPVRLVARALLRVLTVARDLDPGPVADASLDLVAHGESILVEP